MGVKTALTLQEAKELFSEFEIDTLQETKNGLVDTTYLTTHYVVKKFENKGRQTQKELLKHMQKKGLNVPVLLASSGDWHLYSRLRGKQINHPKYPHIVALARFLKKLHTLKLPCRKPFYDESVIKRELRFAKKRFFFYFKRFEELSCNKPKDECFIHGDLFLDNAVFDDNKIGVFDFGDSGCGEAAFDAGVALTAFGVEKREGLVELFLRVYNQNNPKKMTEKALQTGMRYAKLYYALRRAAHYKRVKEAKQLL